MWRPAVEQDLEWVFPFLYRHIHSSMFLLGNLRDFGLGSSAPYALRLWVIGTGAADDQGAGIFGITNSGTVLMQAPSLNAESARDAVRRLEGAEVLGILGDAMQVRLFASVSGLDQGQMQLDTDDHGFQMALSDLRLGGRDGDVLCPLGEVDRQMVEGWRAHYNHEVLGFGPSAADEAATRDIEKYLRADSHRVLISNGAPVAMTGFNTRLPDVVQVGGVFTPPDLRGRGHARHAVALHLAEARSEGTTQAVLFAANSAAAAAYCAVGFKPAGMFSLMLFSQAQKISTSAVERCT